MPWLYEKLTLKVRRISAGGEWGEAGSEEEVEAVVYVDVQRKEEGRIEKEVSRSLLFGAQLACGI